MKTFLSMRENEKSCVRILLGGALGGGIGIIVKVCFSGVPGTFGALVAGAICGVLGAVLGIVFGVVLGPVLRFLAGSHNVEAAEPGETSVSSDEKSQTE